VAFKLLVPHQQAKREFHERSRDAMNRVPIFVRVVGAAEDETYTPVCRLSLTFQVNDACAISVDARIDAAERYTPSRTSVDESVCRIGLLTQPKNASSRTWRIAVPRRRATAGHLAI